MSTTKYPRNILELPTDLFLKLTQVSTLDIKDIDTLGMPSAQVSIDGTMTNPPQVICLPYSKENVSAV